MMLVLNDDIFKQLKQRIFVKSGQPKNSFICGLSEHSLWCLDGCEILL